jgi:hypothetical protein
VASPGKDSSGAATIFKDEMMKKKLFSMALAVLSTLGGSTAVCLAQQGGQTVQVENPEYVRLIDRLGNVGERIVKSNNAEELLALSMEQADTLEGLIAMSSRAEEKNSWIRQLAECLTAAATQSPKDDLRAASRMAHLRASVDQAAPGSALAAFVGFHQLEIDHARLAETASADAGSVQQSWRHLLANFINAYPHASETSKALIELANLSEAAGKDEDARRCYRFMLEYQPDGCDIRKAQGALNRLNLTGQEFHLTLPLLKADTTSDEPFDVESLKGHVVIVYFWSVASEHWLADMRQVAGVAADRRCQLVCVNCDAKATEAVKALGNHQLGIQLHQRNGLEGRVSQRMGLFEVPYVLVVGKSGRVINKGVEMANLQRTVADHLDDPLPEEGVKPSTRMSTSRWLTIGK